MIISPQISHAPPLVNPSALTSCFAALSAAPFGVPFAVGDESLAAAGGDLPPPAGDDSVGPPPSAPSASASFLVTTAIGGGSGSGGGAAPLGKSAVGIHLPNESLRTHSRGGPYLRNAIKHGCEPTAGCGSGLTSMYDEGSRGTQGGGVTVQKLD